MKDLLDFILKMITASLFLYLINHLLMLEIPYNLLYLIIIAFLGLKGILLVLLLFYYFNN